MAAVSATALLFSFLAVNNFKGRAEPVDSLKTEDGANRADYAGLDSGNRDGEGDARSPIRLNNGDNKAENDDGVDLSSIPGLTDGKAYPKKLVEEGSTNILIIGEDKENLLYDTVGILSIDHKSKKMKIIMIPRDMYVQYNKKVLRVLENAGKLNVAGVFKINYAHHIGPLMKYEGKFKPYTSISFLADVIKEKFNIEADDYIKLNTDGFAQAVDLFGGIDINVPYTMNYDDPAQGLYIHIEKGFQRLDGRQAEGFVRYRQGYDENGKFHSYDDVERKNNQIAFIKAFIKQHGSVKNIDKVPELIRILGRNIQHSIGVGDVLFKYLGAAKDVILKKYEIESVILSSGKEKYMMLAEE